MKPVRLCSLRVGESAVVTALTVPGEMRRRLLDIGLIEGTPVCCLGRSPGGSLGAYGIRGAVIAIRDSDAALVWITGTEKAVSVWD